MNDNSSNPEQIWWGRKLSGSSIIHSTAMNCTQEELICYDGIPNWVRLPADLGGKESRVLGVHTGPCPLSGKRVIEVRESFLPHVVACGDKHIKHLELEDGIHVAECEVHGFVWYRHRKPC
jgi:hypothetical protein